jgi:GTPase SAR1 family protein
MANQVVATLIGTKGVGKTTLLATMYQKLRDFNGLTSISITPSTQDEKLREAYNKLPEELNKQKLHTAVPNPLLSTTQIIEYKFGCDFRGERNERVFDLSFYDTPGELLSTGTHPELEKFKKRLKESQFIINVIDGAAYMVGDIFNEDEKFNSSARVASLLKDVLKDEHHPDILFVITKCERWIDDEKALKELKTKFEEHHKEVLGLIKKSRGIFMPVKTLGCYRFNHPDEEKKEIVHVKTKRPFESEGVEKPLCYIIPSILATNRDWWPKGISNSLIALKNNEKCYKLCSVYDSTIIKYLLHEK